MCLLCKRFVIFYYLISQYVINFLIIGIDVRYETEEDTKSGRLCFVIYNYTISSPKNAYYNIFKIGDIILFLRYRSSIGFVYLYKCFNILRNINN